MIEALKPLLLAIGTPIVRSVLGWLQHALADRKVTKFEWRQLAETTVRVGLIAACQYAIAAGFFDMDMGTVEMISIAASTILMDKLFNSLKENKNVTRT